MMTAIRLFTLAAVLVLSATNAKANTSAIDARFCALTGAMGETMQSRRTPETSLLQELNGFKAYVDGRVAENAITPEKAATWLRRHATLAGVVFGMSSSRSPSDVGNFVVRLCLIDPERYM